MISLHRFCSNPGPNDLSRADLADLYGLMLAEGLVELYFHDASVRCLEEFMAFASSPDVWFYAAQKQGRWVGFGVCREFSGSGRCAMIHGCAFKDGRGADIRLAAREWLKLVHARGGLESVVTVTPHCYRGARKLVRDIGFTEAARLPGAMLLYRKGDRTVLTDAVVSVLIFNGG